MRRVDLERKIRDLLESDPKIDFVLLFGSTARGEEREGSDLDLAVGLAPGTQEDSLSMRLRILSKLSGLSDRVDVVIASRAPPALAYRIARDSALVFARDERSVTRFRARAYGMYLDFKRFLRMHGEAMLERIEEGAFGR
jgi:predicted nucleotidyltransferase